MSDSTGERAGWTVRDMHGRPVAVGRTRDEAEATARRIGAMPDRARFEPVTTEAEFLALQLTLPDEETDMSESTSVEGWIVYGSDWHPVAAGPTLDEACDTARAVGAAEGYFPQPATEAELDALDLPPRALGIREGGRPWWRYPAPPDGPTDRPVIAPAGEDVRGPRVHVWGPAPGYPSNGSDREYLGRGHLLGFLHRERTYMSGSDVPHFRIGPEYVAATAGLDVSLPIVAEDANPDRGEYLPEHPRCPDCGGRIARAEAGRDRGSRRCEGEGGLVECPGCDGRGEGLTDDPAWGGVMEKCNVCEGTGNLGPDGCGSTFVDTRYGAAMPVPGGEA